MIEISVMTTPEDVAAVRDLVRAYVRWLGDRHPDEREDILSYYSPERLRRALDEIPTAFSFPNGLALIAHADGTPVGCVLVHPLEPGVAEMKRLFVLPSARGKGLGARLVRTLIDHMAAWGYPTIRLDTAVYLTDAIALYRHLGFVEIDPYGDMPPGSVKVAMFMELRSQGIGSNPPPDPPRR